MAYYKEYSKKYYQKNKKKKSKYAKIWYQKNKEKRSDYAKEYRKRKFLENPNYADYEKNIAKKTYQKNKEKILQKQKDEWKNNYLNIKQWFNNYQKEQRKIPRNHLDCNFSNSMRNSLNGNKRGRKWETLVGYTLQDLIWHLEKQFDDKMNWENYGSYWHIDHIVPKSWFPYQTAEEQAFKDCWGLANLQPLEALANFSKNNRFISF